MESTENADFYNYWCIFKRRWLPALAVFSTVVALTSLYISLREPIYKAKGELVFRRDATSSLIGLGSAKKEENEQQNDSTQATEAATEARIMLSTPILQKVVKQVNTKFPQENLISLEELQQNIEITKVEKTNVIQVSYPNKNPVIAAFVVNQLIDTYVESNLLNKRAAAISAGNFITAQLPKVKGNVYRAELAVRRFKEKNQVTDLDETQKLLAANIERVRTETDSVETKLVDLNSQIEATQNRLGMSSQQAIAVESLSQSPVVQGILPALQDVQRRLADARVRYQETNPIIVRLKDKEARVKTLIQEQLAQTLQERKTSAGNRLQLGKVEELVTADLIKLEAERLGLVTKKVVLTSQLALYQQQVAGLPKLEQEQQELQRELSAAISTYETLLKNLQEIKVIENKTVGNVRIIEHALVPKKPINTNKTSAMIAGSLSGILLAAAAISILELTDKRIKSIKEARQIFEYTLLGVIPLF